MGIVQLKVVSELLMNHSRWNNLTNVLSVQQEEQWPEDAALRNSSGAVCVGRQNTAYFYPLLPFRKVTGEHIDYECHVLGRATTRRKRWVFDAIEIRFTAFAMTINSTDRESQATSQKMKDVYVGPVAKVLS